MNQLNFLMTFFLLFTYQTFLQVLEFRTNKKEIPYNNLYYCSILNRRLIFTYTNRYYKKYD